MSRRATHRIGVALAFAASLPVPVVARAQPGVAQASGGGTQILFLGTGGGPPLSASRSKPATLLIVDGRYYLIDCGMGTMQRLLQAGVNSQKIRTIFLTHLHSDHDLGLADVLANDYFLFSLRRAADTVDIYGPPRNRRARQRRIPLHHDYGAAIRRRKPFDLPELGRRIRKSLRRSRIRQRRSRVSG